jgi:hypothetical protein
MFHERSIQFAALTVILDLLISIFVFLVLLNLQPLIFPGSESDYLAHLGILFMVLALSLGLRLSPTSRQQPPLNYLSARQIVWIILKDRLILFTVCMGLIFVVKLTVEAIAMSELALVIRRIFDVVVVLAFSPLIALIPAAAIKLDSARPGMTCQLQISGRSDLYFDDRLKLDLYYIDNWSIWLDLKFLIKTIPSVLRGNGAA